LLANLGILADVEVEYITLPGWEKDTTTARSYYDLPLNARKYIEYIEEFLKVPVNFIGTGPGRENIIHK
jgi:adenylosuccinate synthase